MDRVRHHAPLVGEREGGGGVRPVEAVSRAFGDARQLAGGLDCIFTPARAALEKRLRASGPKGGAHVLPQVDGMGHTAGAAPVCVTRLQASCTLRIGTLGSGGGPALSCRDDGGRRRSGCFGATRHLVRAPVLLLVPRREESLASLPRRIHVYAHRPRTSIRDESRSVLSYTTMLLLCDHSR